MLNGVISEPGYGSGKQGKERVFVTTDELSAHSHDYLLDTTKKGEQKSSTGAWYVDAGTIGTTEEAKARTTEAVGGDKPHNNIQPCIAAYGWRRTA